MPSSRRLEMRTPVVALLLGSLCACPAPGPSDAPAPLDDVARATALLSPSARLPSRAEVVALADQIAIRASKEGAVEEQAKLDVLAADLRVRLHRIEGTDTDAREALELYAAAARVARGTEAACWAERARSLLLGELARDAATSYRELYLVKRRHASLAPEGKSSACLDAVSRDLALAQGFRPAGAELAALEKEGDNAERTVATASSATAAATVVPAGATASSPVADLVVAPIDLKPAKGISKIQKIEKFAAEGGGRVVIHLSEPTTFQVGTLDADDAAGKDARIYLDIEKAAAKGVAKEIQVGGAIKRVRTGPREGGVRVVLDLSGHMHRRVFYLPEPFRIVIDVSSRPPEQKAAANGPRTVKRVAIDPGHGGHDDGAVGPTGLKEKEVALDIAHRVAPVLAHELGVETLLTRDSDVFIPLEERTARANAFHADLFISIHCNASENGEARGIEVFVLDQLKDTSRAAARVAALENGLSVKKGIDPESLDKEMSQIVGRLQSGEISASSRRLGDLVARATLASFGPRYPDVKDHGLKSAGFYVLLGAEMPAVLFETSFISNPDDESRLAKADYRQKLADGVVNAVRAYREGK